MAETKKTTKRIMIWAHPRTRSTILEMCLAAQPTIKAFHEPYIFVDLFAADRVIDPDFPCMSDLTKAEVQRRLEADYEGYDTVLAKDIPVSIVNDMQYFPRGFIHAFIIRRPDKAIPSLYEKVNGLSSIVDWLKDPITTTSKLVPLDAVLSVAKYVKDELGQKPIIVDGDDLAAAPAATLQKFCSDVGIPFSNSMLKWKPGNGDPFVNEHIMGSPVYDAVYKTATESTHFIVQKKDENNRPLPSDLPIEMVKLIEQSKPIYDELVKLMK
ncbi:uncharacterized protein LOC102800755 [Saccoglossus kowalevskii]|uniref:Branched-chain-amino-acid aminotransferase-like protein 2-like n=1 Tax=Saccoglossus kowalevskii TaxID=10224 RepID=A0ABM0LWT3_SACKO|nr:PREDICTED: branched-chain-amino-acid aminotransferase-like protein 2-like [Saccoglossus kowalevskii]